MVYKDSLYLIKSNHFMIYIIIGIYKLNFIRACLIQVINSFNCLLFYNFILLIFKENKTIIIVINVKAYIKDII